jgi:hypothetical protein
MKIVALPIVCGYFPMCIFHKLYFSVEGSWRKKKLKPRIYNKLESKRKGRRKVDVDTILWVHLSTFIGMKKRVQE